MTIRPVGAEFFQTAGRTDSQPLFAVLRKRLKRIIVFVYTVEYGIQICLVGNYISEF